MGGVISIVSVYKILLGLHSTYNYVVVHKHGIIIICRYIQHTYVYHVDMKKLLQVVIAISYKI